MRTPAVYAAGLALILGLALAACSNSGGREAAPSSQTPAVRDLEVDDPPKQIPLQPFVADEEYNKQWGLAHIGADVMYEAGITGQGVEIGIIDQGFKTLGPDLDDPLKLNKICDPISFCENDENQHGFQVASVAAGDRDGSGMQGVAYRASINFIARGGGDGSLPQCTSGDSTYDCYVPVNPAYIPPIDEWLTHLLTAARESDVVNISSGYLTIASHLLDADFKTLLPRAIEAAQVPAADGKRAIFVLAAGNSNGMPLRVSLVPDLAPETYEILGSCLSLGRVCLRANAPNFQAALPYFAPEELDGYWIAVAALGPEDELAYLFGRSNDRTKIAYYSNRCGIAGEFCIAAPGTFINAANSDGTVEEVQGTSYAAPLVSGALALLIEYFTDDDGEMLARKEITRRLFATADKSGDYAPDAILDANRRLSKDCNRIDEPDPDPMFPLCQFSADYGQGVLDLHNAMTPQGALRLAQGADIAGVFVTATGSRLNTAAAFGDALAMSGAAITLFDDYHAPFSIPLSSFILRSSERVSLAARAFAAIRADGRQTRHISASLALRVKDFVGADSSLPFVTGSGTEFSFIRRGERTDWRAGFFAGGVEDGKPFYGARAGFGVHSGGFAARWQFGVMREENALLGQRSEGGFGDSGASINFLTGLEAELMAAADTKLIIQLHGGMSQTDRAADGMVQGFSPVLTSAFAIGLHRRNVMQPDDALIIRLTQPVRAEKGEMTLFHASGRTAEGKIRYRHTRLDLAPSGRALETELAYAVPYGAGGLRVSAGYAREADHRAGREEVFAGFGFIRPF